MAPTRAPRSGGGEGDSSSDDVWHAKRPLDAASLQDAAARCTSNHPLRMAIAALVRPPDEGKRPISAVCDHPGRNTHETLGFFSPGWIMCRNPRSASASRHRPISPGA